MFPRPSCCWGNAPQACFGTFAWAAPEMLLGEQPTAAADVYSLGVVLWELCTGELPRRGQRRDPLPSEAPLVRPRSLRQLLAPEELLYCAMHGPVARHSRTTLVRMISVRERVCYLLWSACVGKGFGWEGGGNMRPLHCHVDLSLDSG